MNFKEAVSYLYSLGNEMEAMKLGLESIRILAAEFDNPQEKFPAVHIAGTNGKGSTAAIVDSILREAGIRTGFYSSPHLISITERVRINGSEIAEPEFARLVKKVCETGERLVKRGKLDALPTFFEQVTMIAYLHFAQSGIEMAVLEVGMGGRLDATSICRPAVTAITPVGMDHQQYLGGTLRAIAAEKAGIIKKGVPVVVAPMKSDAVEVITARSHEIGAPLIDVETEVRSSDLFMIEIATERHPLRHVGKCHMRYRTPNAEYAAWVNLRGRHQVLNALTSVHIAEELKSAGTRIPIQAIQDGLNKVEWPGRLEVIDSLNNDAPFLLDGAHNPAGAITLRAFLDEHFYDVPVTMIFGLMQDKETEEMARILFPAAERIILTKIENSRAADPAVIAESVSRLGFEAVVTNGIDEALELAAGVTSNKGLIVACGSLFLVGDIRRRL